MRLLKIIATLTVLTVLTGACGVFTHHAGKPVLKRVWKISNGTLDTDHAAVVGNTVIANVTHDSDITQAESSSLTGVFIDGSTGRIRGRARTGDVSDAGPVTDKHGRSLVDTDTPAGDFPERVFDPTGHLVWRAHTLSKHFVGGYTTEAEKFAGKYWDVIRTTSGRLVTRLPEPKDVTNLDDAEDYGGPIQVVRPGLLVATGYGPSGSEATLIDASRPGQARLSRLRPPPAPSHHDQLSVNTAVGGGHVYVQWGVPTGKVDVDTFYVARYDVPGTRPTWRVPLPDGVIPDHFQASANGQETLAFDGNVGGDDTRVWLLRPDTGALIGPKSGRKGRLQLHGLVGGRAYIDTGQSETQMIDPHNGSARTIPVPTGEFFVGALSNGYLIYGSADGLYAYRWN